jgi:hypothetical protein
MRTKRPLWRDSFLWLALALTSFAAAPFLLPGYFWGANDARHHVYFLFEYDRLVQDGIWWPRWSPDFAFGYGYPFFNIYGPFSHFLAELLHHFLGFSFTAAVESIFVLSIVAAAAAMYAFVRTWCGRTAAVIAALVYTYAPYHLLNLYVRANLAESMAFVWLPLCLWTARQSILASRGEEPARQNTAGSQTPSDAFTPAPGVPAAPGASAVGASAVGGSLVDAWPWIAGLAVAYALLMLTSNLVVVLFTPLLAAYILVLTIVYALPPGTHARTLSRPQRLGLWLRRCLPPALGGFGGLGLSAIFWLPMLLERSDVRVDQWFGGRYDFRGHFVYFHQLFSPTWGFGVSVPGPLDPIGFQIGAVALTFAVLGLLLFLRRDPPPPAALRPTPPPPAVPSRPRGFGYEVAFFAAAAVLATVPALQFAAPLWELPLLGALLQSAQFPWRWLVLTTLCVSILAGLVAASPARTAASASDPSSRLLGSLPLALLALAAVVILGSYPYLQVQITPPAEGPVSLAGLMRFQQSSDEMTGSTRWVKEIPTWSPMADYYISQANQGLAVKPVDSKLDYTIFDYKTFAAESVAHSTVSEEIFYANQATAPQTLVFNHFYYPGWHAYLLDGQHGRRLQQLPIVPETQGTLGRMTVAVPPGEGYLLLVYEDTPPRTVGGAISAITLLMLLTLSALYLRHTRRTSTRPPARTSA